MRKITALAVNGMATIVIGMLILTYLANNEIMEGWLFLFGGTVMVTGSVTLMAAKNMDEEGEVFDW